jgi:hypothetical protein
MCVLKIDVDSIGELAFNLSGGWTDFCTAHGLLAQYIASNVMYASVYPRVRVEEYLKSSNGEE